MKLLFVGLVHAQKTKIYVIFFKQFLYDMFLYIVELTVNFKALKM